MAKISLFFILTASVWANILEERQENISGDQKSDQIKVILELIKGNAGISRTEISEKPGLHASSVKRRMKMFVDEGIIRRVGPDKGGYWKVLSDEDKG